MTFLKAGVLAVVVAFSASGFTFAQSERPKPRPDIEPVAMSNPAAEDAEVGISEPETAVAPVEPVAADPPLRDPAKGSVTNLPLPRFVSLKTNEGNARRGPGLTHRIDWVFTRAGMPLKITAEFENWRRVEDVDGLGGWVHYSLLSGVRSVIVKGDLVDFHSSPRPDATIAFRAEAGVVGRVLSCHGDWCRIQVDGQRGWVPMAALWGVEAGEHIE